MIDCAIIVHGGAGTIPKSRYQAKFDGCKKAARIGYKILLESGDVLTAVEKAVNSMEDDEAFNAGYGSCLTQNEEIEMDALIIRGSDLKAGGVGAVKHVKYPISLARLVMEKTDHCLLVGDGAEIFAKENNLELVTTEQLTSPNAKATLKRVLEKNERPTTEPKEDEGNEKGTVGAVAINSKGEIAAATSTGGITGKKGGRVGDTPVIGSGTYCDDNICGISTTGIGEAIMRVCLASRIANLMEHEINGKDAIIQSLEFMSTKIPDSSAGAIAIRKDGEIYKNFNSKIMSWAYIKNNELHYGIEKNENIMEKID